jgi:transglutaminase-like putative cysteine protease
VHRYRIVHRASYLFGTPAHPGPIVARLTPRRLATQDVDAHRLVVRPLPRRQERFVDQHGNPCWRFELAQPTLSLELTATSIVGRRAPQPPPPTEPWEHAAEPCGAVDEDFFAYAAPCFEPRRPLAEAVAALAAAIRRDFVYDRRATTAATTAIAALRLRRGVCQDLANVALASLRARGLRARYVSGYLAGAIADRRRVDMHAWAAVRTRDGTWLDFDPTLGALADERHLVVAWGDSCADATTIVAELAERRSHRLDVRVRVEACHRARNGAA